VLSVAARGGKPLAGEPRGIVGGKENGDAGDIVRDHPLILLGYFRLSEIYLRIFLRPWAR
jgi:hypothetical protein